MFDDTILTSKAKLGQMNGWRLRLCHEIRMGRMLPLRVARRACRLQDIAQTGHGIALVLREAEGGGLRPGAGTQTEEPKPRPLTSHAQTGYFLDYS